MPSQCAYHTWKKCRHPGNWLPAEAARGQNIREEAKTAAKLPKPTENQRNISTKLQMCKFLVASGIENFPRYDV